MSVSLREMSPYARLERAASIAFLTKPYKQNLVEEDEQQLQ